MLAGAKTLNNITHSYDGLKGLGVNVVHDWVDAIDATAKILRLRCGATVGYDKLILSPGIAIRWGALNGYDEAAAEQFPHAWIPGNGEQNALLRRQLEALPDGGSGRHRHPRQPVPLPAGALRAHLDDRELPQEAQAAGEDPGARRQGGLLKQSLFTDAWNELYPA